MPDPASSPLARHGDADLPMPPARPSAWGAQALWAELSPLLPGLSVEVVARIGSTNTELLDRVRHAQTRQARSTDEGTDGSASRRAEDPVAFAGPGARRQGDAAPCLLVAEHQSQGRGRQGKRWQSSPGRSLTFSLGLPLQPQNWSGLSLAVGLALAEAIDPTDPTRAPRVWIKWPNDLLLVPPDGVAAVSGRKLSGILIETLPLATGRYAVIGIGVNLAPEPALSAAQARGEDPDLPWGRADVAELCPGLEPAQWLARLLPPLVRAVRAFEADGLAPLLAGFSRRDALRGQRVVTSLPGVSEGVADGIDADGTLWVQQAGQRVAIASGEVSLRRAGAARPAADGAASEAGAPC